MFLLYIPKCKPFYKFSLLALQVQIGIKCNLAPTKGFGLSTLKTSIKDTFGMPDSLYDILPMNGSQISPGETHQPYSQYSPQNMSVLEFESDSEMGMEELETMIVVPPSPPKDCVLWQKQPLKEYKDATGKPVAPSIFEKEGFEFVRVEDLAIPCRSPVPTSFKKQGPQETPEALFERARVKEYIYTGNREQDLRALRNHIDVCNQSVRALDPIKKSARSPNRFKLRMEMTAIMDSLKEEFELLVDEPDGIEYYGFSEGLGRPIELSRQRIRPKGHRWTCPGWL